MTTHSPPPLFTAVGVRPDQHVRLVTRTLVTLRDDFAAVCALATLAVGLATWCAARLLMLPTAGTAVVAAMFVLPSFCSAIALLWLLRDCPTDVAITPDDLRALAVHMAWLHLAMIHHAQGRLLTPPLTT